jgi:hypothetical protein
MLIAAIAVAAILAILLIYASTRPGTFRVERSATIAAPPARVFALIDDFHSWAAWSPWEHLDPAMKKTYSGPASGPGAIYEWEGNSKAGKGRMEIVNSAASSLVDIKLDFLKPFEAHNTAVFNLEPVADSTKISWAMLGTKPLMMKVIGIFMNMDAMIGKDFERGLANLKSIAEKQP